MFELFDNVYLLARGQCVYQGSPKTFVPFLQSQNFECPKYNNPADYSKFIVDIQ
jgi:ABC-type multidrug transport system ATPase subunit